MYDLRVRDLMTCDVRVVEPGDDLATVRDVMDQCRVRHVPVVDGDGDLVGLVSHRDLLRHALIEQSDVPSYVERTVLTQVRVREVMTGEVDTVEPDTDIREAARLMLENKYGCLPVVEGRHLVGILCESDFVRLLADGH